MGEFEVSSAQQMLKDAGSAINISGNLERVGELQKEVDDLKAKIAGTAPAPSIIDQSQTSGPSISQLFNQTALNLFAEDPEALKAISALMGK